MIKTLIRMLRMHSWWNYIIPPVLSAVYFVVLIEGYSFIKSLSIIALWFVSIIGTAAFGFTLNDLFDAKPDKRAGKINHLALLSKWKQLIIVILSMVIAITPLTILNLSSISIVLICSQFTLLFLYSVPPIRLKDNVYWSTILDSLYSGLIFIIAIIFSSELSTNIVLSNIYLTIAIIFLFSLRGLRNILNHHIIDSKYDKLLNTGNFAVKYGDSITLRIIKTFAFIEFMLLILIAFIIPKQFQEFYFYFLLFSIIYFTFKLLLKNNKIKSLIEKIQFTNDIYEDLLPLLLLTLLTIQDYNFVILFIFQVIVFKNKVVSMILLTFFVSFLYGIIYRKSCGLINRILGTKL